MKKFLFIIILLNTSLVVVGQSKQITLKEAIEIAKKQSPDYKTNINRNQGSYWRFRNYKASFLPQFRIDATLPEYNNSIRRITNDNGQDTYVNQNQLIVNSSLGISQNIPYTGGRISVFSNIERIELFGLNDNIGYSVIPFSINYYQNSLLYNPFKWQREIEPLMFEESKREFIETMEEIAVTTCNQYFSLLKAQMQLEIAKKNVANQDTLYQISLGRFKMGKIAENELLQMELTLLNSKNTVTTNTIDLKRASQNLSRYLEIENENIILDVPEKLPLFDVDVKKALEEAQSNRKAVVAFRRKRLEAERELARAKGTNKVEMSLNANFGISNNANDFNTLFNNYNKQQNVSLTLSVPIFDWGVSKSRRKMAEADLELVNNNVEQEKQAFEQEIYLHVLNWSNQRDFLYTAEKAKEVATKRYEISNKRYVLGKITITDLNIALQEKDKAVLQYLNSLEKFWRDYYILRQLTLYDFIKNEKIKVEDLIYD
ncbi:TolC family protein [Aestuariibaculum sediminum]|uniref:TolC family protein n=1 Tax=Aestuariibaculum sediminum TaxID=2770637 RepID=A0A8J6QM52_9FLAO|nr:TolC family protein [Aestuariibaculum sediminum]MBD0833559.1 TolC family protein [Aestuariibaculum sediminum]